MRKLISEDVFCGEDYDLAEFAELVDGEIFDIAEDAVVVYATLHIIFLESLEAVESSCGQESEEFAARVVVVAHVAVGQIGECQLVVDIALCAAAGVETGLGEFEGGFAAGHVVDDFIERGQGIEQLVVLCGDRGYVRVGAVFLGGRA